MLKSQLHRMAGNISAELLGLTVETGVWSPVRALDHIQQLSDERLIAESLAAVLPRLPKGLRMQAHPSPKWPF